MKRSICFILTILLFITNQSVTKVYSATEDDAAFDEAFELLCELDILPENADYDHWLLEEGVTRATFAHYVSNTIQAENLVASAKKYFNDVAKNDWAYDSISALVELGAIAVGPDRIFYPNRLITVKEAYKMMLDLMGYSEYAKVNGGYPTGYLLAAKKTGLSQHINDNDKLSYGEMIKLLYNFLHANVIESNYISTLKGIKYKSSETKTVMSVYRGIYCHEGVVTETEITSLTGAASVGENHIKIDNIIYDTTNVRLDLLSVIGSNVKSYYKTENGINTLVYLYIDTSKNEALTMDINDVVKFENNILTYHDGDGKDKKIEVGENQEPYVIKNGVAVTVDVSNAFQFDNGTVTLIKSGDTDYYNLIRIEAYTNVIVKDVDYDQRIIYNYYDTLDNLYLDDQRIKRLEVYAGNQYLEQMIETIMPRDVLTVCKSDDLSYCKIVVSNEKVVGMIASIEEKNDTCYVEINKRQYKVDRKCLKYYEFHVGDYKTFYLDHLGNIALVETAVTQERLLGYVCDYSFGRGLKDRLQLKIFSQDGTHSVYTTAQKVNVDNRTVDCQDVYTALSDSSGNFKKQLIFYELNEDGEIKFIDTAENDKNNTLRDTFRKVVDNQSLTYYSSPSMFYPTTPINDKTIIFVVPADNVKNDREEMYRITNKSWLASSKTYIIDSFKYNDNSPYAEVVVVKTTSDSLIATSTMLTLVSRVTKVVNSDGAETVQITGLRNGAVVKEIVSEQVSVIRYESSTNDKGEKEIKKVVREISANDLDIEEGDVVRLAVNAKNEVDAIEIVFDISEDDSPAPVEGSSSAFNAEFRLDYAYVSEKFIPSYNQTGLMCILKLGKKDGSVIDEYLPVNPTSVNVMIYDKNRKKGNRVYIGSVNDIVDYKSSGGSACSKILIHTNYTVVKSYIVFR